MIFLDHWLLTFLLLIPAAGGLAVLFLNSVRVARLATLGLTLATLCLSLLVLVLFHHQVGQYRYGPSSVQMVCRVEFFSAIHWSYCVAVDGLSLPFLLVTSSIGLLACVASWDVEQRPAFHFAMLLLLEAATIGVFLSFDLLLLWTFLAVSLVPCSVLIYLEAGQHRRAVIVNFLAHMLVGIACLFVATLGVRLVSARWFAGETLDLVRLASQPCAERSLYLLMLIGFVVRLAVFPLHFWLVAVMREGSLAAAMLVALIPLTGGYGLLRIAIPLFPSVAASLGWLSAGLGVLTLLHSTLCAIGLNEIRPAAVHVWLATSGMALLGVASLTAIGANGATLIWLSQVLIAPCLIALISPPVTVAGRAEPARSLSVPLAIGWIAELVMPGLLGATMVLLGMFGSFHNGSALLSTGVEALMIAAMCLGTVLLGLAGIRILRRIDQIGASNRAGPQSLSPPVAVAAVLLAIFIVPLCFAYTKVALSALLFRSL